MRKLKLLFAACALLLGAGQTWAQTDVTSTYITDADFVSSDGWTQNHSNTNYWALGHGQIGTYAVANDKNSTTDDTHLNSEHCLGMQCRWSTNYANFTQTKENATLPAGVYTISYDVQNTNTSTSATYDNNFFVEVGETTYSDTKTEWMNGSSAWTTHTISFTLEEETTANFTISFGYGTGSNNFGSTATPHLYVSHLVMTYAAVIRPTAVSIDETLALTVGGTATLTPSYTPTTANTDTDITWNSSAPTVATVADGVVTAVGPGTATITATTANNLSATCTVTVTDVAEAAAPSSWSEIGAGDFYLVNAATGKYLGTLKAGWGTQAALTEHGIPFTATISDGKYTLNSHTYNSENDHFLNNGYVDQPSISYTITSLGNGKYSIAAGEASFLTATATTDNAIVNNSAPTANSVLAQWYFVSKDDLEAMLASATNASPVDATFYIGDPDFSRNHIIKLMQNGKNTDNPGKETYPWQYTVTNYHFKGGANGNMCAETYQNGGGKVYQTLSNVRNGKYIVKCQGFRNTNAASYLYANDEKVELAVLNANNENTAASMEGASAAFSAGQYNNELTVYVTDGELTIGIENASSNWACFDNFELYYYGPTVAGEAEELPETAMEANKWYYFDVDIDGDYDFTTTTLSDIVYTTDGTILIENESSVTANFSSESECALTTGRYYVKSASEQTFAVAAHSFNYEVGAATLSTADGGYTQSQTFTVTFPEASTNDPDGEAALDASSTATVNGNSVALTAIEGGFSLDLGTLTANTDYEIAIPAGVYGYADVKNEAINVTIHTPALFDGEYCFYDATTKMLMGRGASWGTELVVDKYGIPFNLKTDAENVSSIEFVDWTGVYVFKTDNNGMFTDNASTGWTILAAGNGYKIKTASGDLYAKIDNGDYGYYVHAVEGEDNATVWTKMTKAQRDAIIANYPTQNISNVITAAGLMQTAMQYMQTSGITDVTVAATTYVNENYQAIDCTSLIGTATFAGSVGDWTWNGTNRTQNGQPAYGTNFAEVWNATGAFTQTIDKANLPAGVYKVTVQGYERRKANDASTALYNAGYNVVSTYLSANGEQVRFTDWNDVDGKPTNTGGAVNAFNDGQAKNTVFVYLDGNTDLTLTVKKPNYIWDCWAIFNNFTLTRYEEKPTTASVNVSDAGMATFCFAYPLDFTDNDVKAYTASLTNDKEVLLTRVYQVPANTGIVLKGAEGTYDIPVIASADEIEGNLMVGTLTETPVEASSEGSYNYMLANGDNGVGFYYVDAETTSAAGKAYLHTDVALKDENGGSRIALIFSDEEATGIATIGQAGNAESEKIYNLGGQRVSKPSKGMYIVNGKKVIK